MAEVVGYWIFVAILLEWPLWRIFAHAGFSPKLSLLIFVPHIGVLIVMLYLAFVPWPVAESETASPDRATE